MLSAKQMQIERRAEQGGVGSGTCRGIIQPLFDTTDESHDTICNRN